MLRFVARVGLLQSTFDFFIKLFQEHTFLAFEGLNLTPDYPLGLGRGKAAICLSSGLPGAALAVFRPERAKYRPGIEPAFARKAGRPRRDAGCRKPWVAA